MRRGCLHYHLKDLGCARMHESLNARNCATEFLPDLRDQDSSLALDLLKPYVRSWLLAKGHFDRSRHLQRDLSLLMQSLPAHYSLNASEYPH